MKVVLETDRFILREITPDDARIFYSLNLDPEVTRYTGDAAFNSISEAWNFLDSYSDYDDHGFGRWIIVERTTGDVWGWCGLKRRSNGDVDMGYRLFQEKWGKGCATECGRACIDYAFQELKLPYIIAEAVVENQASFKVMERLGFEFTREGEDHGYKTRIYTLNKEQFEKILT